MSRLVVVSNRVTPPRRGTGKGTGLGIGEGGGLAVAVHDALRERGGLWYGWSGRTAEGEAEAANIVDAGKIRYATIDLSQQDYEEYYTGYANSVLWPLFHYRLDLTDFSRRDRAGYQRVNDKFADLLMPLLEPDDVIWVHDYHFIPLAESLRARGGRQKIGFFLHIPWPAKEVLVALPGHEALVWSLCAYDLIGFQTEDDRSAFFGYVKEEVRGRVAPGGEVHAFGQSTRAGTFPISIDTVGVANVARSAARSAQTRRLKDSIDNRKLIIGVDRLDYTKGLVARLEAYEHLLEAHPDIRRNVVLLQISPPSRSDVTQYQEIRHEVETAVGRINASYAEFDWNPIRYLSRGFRRQTLAGFFRVSDVGLVTPLRDGMNLVAKEYVAAQSQHDPGILVLSRFAGAARELDGALIVNPYDIEGVGETLQIALTMPLEERVDRWQMMYDRLKENDIAAWRDSYLAALRDAPCAAVAPA